MTELLPGQPELDGEPVFREPWEAHAFAIVVQLHERGLFTWPEWAAMLAEEVAREPDTAYYAQWLRALERIVDDRGAVSAAAQDHTRDAWRRAAARTPHGHPIELTPADYDT